MILHSRQAMDIEKTKQYYSSQALDSLCTCAFCQNYHQHVRETYPALAECLRGFGVDIEFPFEVFPLAPEENDCDYIDYLGAQYLIAGSSDGFHKTEISGFVIDLATSHPASTWKEEHFIIQVFPTHNLMRMQWSQRS